MSKEAEELLNRMKKKYKLALFMVIRNSKVAPMGIELGKTQKEINKMSYETLMEVLGMIDYTAAEKMYNEGREMFNEKKFKILTGGRGNGRIVETALDLLEKVNKLPPDEIFNLVRTKNGFILIYKDKEK